MGDLLISGGTLIDGTGSEPRRADVLISDGVVAEIGDTPGALAGRKADRAIDAEGHVVTPGFIDVHTHMDAQIAWDPMGESSCFHGVTTAVMGNCGFTLAPARPDARHLVVRNLERAEDISAEAMAAGIDWTWETFPEYLDFVDATPKGINYAGYLGHSALRTWAMGEAAFDRGANDDELALMLQQLRDSLHAGAIGFTTSISYNHETADDRPVASRLAEWSEIDALVSEMGAIGAGIFELANHGDLRSRDTERNDAYVAKIVELAARTRVPTTYGMLAPSSEDHHWKPVIKLLDGINAAGGTSWGQAARKPIWSHIYPLTRPLPPFRTMDVIAAERGVSPMEAFVDLALDSDLEMFFVQALANQDQDLVLHLLKHPRAIPTFSDSGAHVTQIMDSSLQTHLLGHWVRDRQEFTLEDAVHRITQLPANAWGFDDRGVLEVGKAADVNVFDPDTVSPDMPELVHDLPAGAARLRQTATGFAATIVNGEVITEHGRVTGAVPGQLLRGPLAR
ncbi:N-acyl-D-amino-acid deacylase family protein [Candidatus Poriferisodalis multihospitum]|uniref:N-acyl-D-amino-acid deacylase family protein n=1 Tax=Candidatus Poriferisodalis multihospitum TaxID=2983191 RepID=UPI002B25EACB|nr:amidohydrolase family protein [Candidatus Poriferisodalis multihospitum]